MIDLHHHLLPGVDDGAADLEEALAMCRLALEDGCEAIVATPHQQHPQWGTLDRGRLEGLLSDVRGALGDGPKLYLGAEIRVTDGLLDALAGESNDHLIPLAGSRYLLLELDTEAPQQQVEELVHELSISGWRPILAHPEFLPGLGDDPGWMARLSEAGALFQVTAMSLTGGFGRRIRRAVKRMLKADLVDFVASDAHRTSWRPPGLQRAFDEIVALRGRETAERLTQANPRAVLENQPLVAYGVA